MSSGASEDRYVYPADGADPRDADHDHPGHDERQVTHPQEREREQGTSADTPGFDPADRERADDAAAPTEEGLAEQGGQSEEQTPRDA